MYHWPSVTLFPFRTRMSNGWSCCSIRCRSMNCGAWVFVCRTRFYPGTRGEQKRAVSRLDCRPPLKLMTLSLSLHLSRSHWSLLTEYKLRINSQTRDKKQERTLFCLIFPMFVWLCVCVRVDESILHNFPSLQNRFPFIRTSDSIHFLCGLGGAARRSAVEKLQFTLNITFTPSHSSMGSCTSRKLSERTKNTSRVRVNDLHNFYFISRSLLQIECTQTHTRASSASVGDADVHTVRCDASIQYVYICVLSNGKQFDQWYPLILLFYNLRVTRITCIV